MANFFLTWTLIGATLLLAFYLYSKVVFFKTLYNESIYENSQLRNGLSENNAMLDFYEYAVSKNASNLDFLEHELVSALEQIKLLKDKNNTLKKENDDLDNQLKETKHKFENLF